MAKMTLEIVTSDDFTKDDLRTYVDHLKNQFVCDSTETGYPAWEIRINEDTTNA